MGFSRIGFGTYRVALGVQQHEEALRIALKNGVTVIDTSSNYTDGGAEKLIGKVISDGFKRDRLFIMSKGGYLQGQTLERYKLGQPYPDVVEAGPGCLHCIYPEFLRDQLQRSLARIGTSYLDVYLLHNPEYYLTENIHAEREVAHHRKEMLRRISNAFIMLEEEVQKEKIRAYGISSNSFSLPKTHMHFLPYEDLLILAQQAAEHVGHTKHSFTTLQFPANLLETEGLEGCGAWAQANHLQVMINRPLNAFDGETLWRLASYPMPEGYDEHYQTTQSLSHEGVKQLMKDLHRQRILFESIGHLENVMYGHVYPLLHEMKEDIEPQEFQVVTIFLKTFSDVIKHAISEKTRLYLHTKNIEVDGPLQEAALQFLLKQPCVTSVLVGMRQKEYVDDTLGILKNYLIKN